MRYRGLFVEKAVLVDKKCLSYLPHQMDGNSIIMAFRVQLYEHINYEQLDSFQVHFKAVSNIDQGLDAKIYTSTSINNMNNYLASCRYNNFSQDLNYGPILWTIDSWTSGQFYSTPDLVKIITPMLDRGTLNWRKYFYIVFQWIPKTPQLQVRLQLDNISSPYYTFYYNDSRPGL